MSDLERQAGCTYSGTSSHREYSWFVLPADFFLGLKTNLT